MNYSIYRSFSYFFFTIFVITGTITLAQDESREVRIVAFGDSLTAGYQLSSEHSFPTVLQKALRGKGYSVTVVNAGVSGDTSTDGLARLDWSIPDGTDAVILELGANDALRGIDSTQTRTAIDRMTHILRERNVEILICGMLAPPNMGENYSNAFNSIFEEVAEKYDTLYYPFFLDGVAAVPELNLDDGIHPNPEGVGVIVERILPVVEQLVERVAEK